MTLPRYTANTYAERLDQWIADEKDAIAAHFAQHGPTLFNDADRLQMFGSIAIGPQLDIEAAINHDRIAEEIDELEKLFVAVRSMGIIDHKARIKEAMTHRNQQWREFIAPSLTEARLAIAPDETNPALQAVIERAVAKRLHEVFDHSTKVYRFEDEPHGLMSMPLGLQQPIEMPAVAAPETVIEAPVSMQHETPPTPPVTAEDGEDFKTPLSQLIPLFFAEVTPKGNERASDYGWTKNTAQQARSSMKLLIAICGDRPLAELKKADGAKLRGKMRDMPAMYYHHAPYKNLYISDDIDGLIEARKAVFKADPSSELGKPMAAKTFNRHFSAYSKLFEWAQTNEFVAEDARYFMDRLFIDIEKEPGRSQV